MRSNKKGKCHYCKYPILAEQSKNLCVQCFNSIVLHFREQNPAEKHYLETLLIGLKPEPLEKLYFKARYMDHLDYCQEIIKFYEEGRDCGQSRADTVKDRVSNHSRTNTDRRGSGTHIRTKQKEYGRYPVKKRNLISAGGQDQSFVPCR